MAGGGGCGSDHKLFCLSYRGSVLWFGLSLVRGSGINNQRKIVTPVRK